MHHIRAEITRPGHAEDRVHVGPVEIDEAPQLVDRWLPRLQNQLMFTTRIAELSDEDLSLAGRLADDQFGHRRWTERR